MSIQTMILVPRPKIDGICEAILPAAQLLAGESWETVAVSETGFNLTAIKAGLLAVPMRMQSSFRRVDRIESMAGSVVTLPWLLLCNAQALRRFSRWSLASSDGHGFPHR
ncbi:hypothetical protein [Desulfogranum marinum]|uniref:hypothetical protein n=1 Tax=Desulfogranum marinum TaxID=453220 RepID=UPI0029C98CDB|nr:hypothetical protein [Desulfogranum marinum]